MLTVWHFEQLAAGKPEWPRRMNPRVFGDTELMARGYEQVVDGLQSDLVRWSVDARLYGCTLGFIWWMPGGVTPAPTPENPGHCEYPDHPFRAAREHAGTDESGQDVHMHKAGNAGLFRRACKRLVELGVGPIMLYMGRPASVPYGGGADPEVLELVRSRVVTHVAMDGTAHMPPMPLREKAMRAYEAAGATVCYEAVPTRDGPGSDLARNPARVCVSDLAQWDALQDRLSSKPEHPNLNVPAKDLPRVILLDRADDPEACRRHVAAGRDVAINVAADRWRRKNLMDLWA